MTSEPVIVQVLEGINAINKYREVMGTTDPKKCQRRNYKKSFGTKCSRKCSSWVRFG